ncbi:aminoglycoside phosphotransferase (APT) family kinase protein [Kribbella voronezhensis]|uniref:Aminoglycoside phosphotransferase (APT) family kinase protein n=1 Tax=Kribbella voronezhensis TaxID=2512212 RepID=A0A4R7TIJ1_9ACTN|nr:aminoglycoside phosphotransferase family protein [Kribbella voronezhensis]TDU91769.1 aminoglycoside phosphotransferase (APT) family kinase protein [Kribbella voronezhensis]
MSNKRQLDDAGLDKLLAEAGIDPATGVTAYEELSEGTFNTVYRILRPAGDLMLKLSPDPAAPVLSYEQGLIQTETEFYRAARGKVPVPEVVHAGDDFLLMTALPGTTWFSATEPLDRPRLRRDLGGLVAELHKITNGGFGYPQKGLVDSWDKAFLAMIDDILRDASHFDVELPCRAEQIRAKVLARREKLLGVQTASLIHFDLWDGNILVEDGRITGLIDGERAFWGDPTAEFVSLTLFSELDDDLLEGYGAPVDRELLALYRVYLYLIMVIEATPRGYDGPENEQRSRRVRRHLLRELDALS